MLPSKCIFKINALLKAICILLISGIPTGCFHYYYKVQKEEKVPPGKLEELRSNNKYFILHAGNQAYAFENVSVDSINLTGIPDSLPEYRNLYLKTRPTGATRYKKRIAKNQSFLLDEVHIYADLPVLVDRQLKIPVEKIYNTEIYQPAKGATALSMIGGVIGVTTSALIAGTVIAQASYNPPPQTSPSGGSTESCPFVYVMNEEKKELVGEIYSGAIYPSLERNDYLPLPDKRPGQMQYTIYMTNELEEIQNTNLIELIAVKHSSDVKVLIDKYGEPQTLINLHSPLNAVNLDGLNIQDKIFYEDSLKYGIHKDYIERNKDGIILTFNRPKNITNAKLVIKAKNTLWLDYVVSHFHELFGEKYSCWIDKQDRISPKKMKNWVLNQDIPLSVYMEKNGKWKFVDYYNIVGPVAAKEDVLSIDLPNSDSDSVKIKLESGYMFWEIDFVGMDFSRNQPVTKQLAKFDSAIDNYGINVKSLLEVSDDQYYSQPEIGDEVTMEFILPDQNNDKQSLFLHSQGFYIRKMNSEGEYYRNYLLTFRKKGKMTEFSNQLMLYQVTARAN